MSRQFELTYAALPPCQGALRCILRFDVKLLTFVELARNCGIQGRAIPKGLHNSAQGCEARATLGNKCKMRLNPNGFVSPPTKARHNPVGVGWSSEHPNPG